MQDVGQHSRAAMLARRCSMHGITKELKQAMAGMTPEKPESRTKELWKILREAVLEGTFNPIGSKWNALTSKRFLSRLAAQRYLDGVEGFFRYLSCHSE